MKFYQRSHTIARLEIQRLMEILTHSRIFRMQTQIAPRWIALNLQFIDYNQIDDWLHLHATKDETPQNKPQFSIHTTTEARARAGNFKRMNSF